MALGTAAAAGAALAVVIPARNEAGRLPLLLADLARGSSLLAECIVVDGGSSDGTPQLASLAGARVIHAAAGRGGQLLAGIHASSSHWLWLLHADVRLPADWPQRLSAVLEAEVPAARRPQLRAWYGDLRLEQVAAGYRALELVVALRSWLWQRPYGDQGLLIARACYEACGGLRPLPLMEDLEFALRFARQGRLCRLNLRIQVDGRRWRQLGLWRTTLANAALRRAWRRGVPAEVLAERYRLAQR